MTLLLLVTSDTDLLAAGAVAHPPLPLRLANPARTERVDLEGVQLVVVRLMGGRRAWEHFDALLASAGSGLATLAVPGTPGVPASAAGETIVLPYNDRGAVSAAFAEHGPRIACLITEAAPGNMGVVPPAAGFNAFLARTQWLRPWLGAIERGAGAFIVLVGVLLLTGRFAALSSFFAGFGQWIDLGVRQ